MTEQSHAVFLSYASQDAGAAQRICGALRAAGIEVFLDQSELRGGDAWDKKIRHEIHDCVLFIPIVSQHTQERLEGYFRHEWKLAIERAHHMAAQKAFLVPVVVDGTGDQEALVPDEFRDVQWTRLHAGETPPQFVTRIQKLLSGESGPLPAMVRRAAPDTTRRSSRFVSAVIAVVLAAVAAYLLVERPWAAKAPPPTSPAAPVSATSVAFSPPPHSIAVLPFVNLSGDKEQEYFSDGLTEELLNSLSRINELQVAARTSSFSFKGEHVDLPTIAHKLNVASVLEGSVRRSGRTIRVTVQLNNAVTGYHLWSQTYDRDLGDVLKLQIDIATAVAGALRVALLGDVAAKIEMGGTRNPAALDAYLRGWRLRGSDTLEQQEGSITAFSEAIEDDPNYALAFAGRSMALLEYSHKWGTLKGKDSHGAGERALSDALRTIALAPDLADGHIALALVHEGRLNFIGAGDEYRKALALAPGYARAWRAYSYFVGNMGDSESALSAARRAISLDPLNKSSLYAMSAALRAARRYQEALSPLEELRRPAPNSWAPRVEMGNVYYKLGDYQRAVTACEVDGPPTPVQSCLALAYFKVGRHADAEASLARVIEAVGDAEAYLYARIYAQWDNKSEALRWLEIAWRLRDSGLESLKTDPLIEPLRNEPRFQAIERALKFPD